MLLSNFHTVQRISAYLLMSLGITWLTLFYQVAQADTLDTSYRVWTQISKQENFKEHPRWLYLLEAHFRFFPTEISMINIHGNNLMNHLLSLTLTL